MTPKHLLRVFLVLVSLWGASPTCLNGRLNDVGCCVCNAGYYEENGDGCATCAPGYFLGPDGTCSNGRPGSPCSDDLPYPFFGCRLEGEQLGVCGAGGVFPCDCGEGQSCEHKAAEIKDAGGGCYPSGARMYATFPNEPTVGGKFSITVVACAGTREDAYAVIPAFTSNLTEENRCETLPQSPVANMADHCVFDGDDDAVLGGANGSSCPSGFLLRGLAPSHGGKGIAEHTFASVLFADGSLFRGTEAERAAANTLASLSTPHGLFEKETYYRLCERVTTPSALSRNGAVTAWKEVANHNDVVDERDFTIKIAKVPLFDPRGAALGSADGEGGPCCEGLSIGSLCLPLWVFLLLWFLMALCLAGLGYSLHKNNQELEAARNNEKYEKFVVDNEMQGLAARQAEDDDI